MNTKLFGFFCFVVFLGALALKVSALEFFFTCLVLVAAGLWLEIYLMLRRSREVVAFLHDRADPELFLAELQKDAHRFEEKKMHDYYLINQSAGLFYLGRWQEALYDLKSVHFQKLPKKQQYLYLNNTLANHLGNGQVQSARDFLRENQDLISSYPRTPELLYLHWKNNCAWLDILEGEFVKSRKTLEDSLTKKISPLMRSISYYLLGLIDIQESKREDASSHFKKALETGNKTFIRDRVAPYILG